MSDNKLLTENTIRRFMQLANTEALTETFLDEESKLAKGQPLPPTNRQPAPTLPKEKTKIRDLSKTGNPALKEEEEEELEENTEELEEEFTLEEEEEEDEMEIDTELGAADEPADELAGEPEMGAADMSLTEEEAQLLISLGERLAAAMGGAEAPADDAMDAPEADAAPELDDEPALDDDDPAKYMQETQEDLVNEVLKRVTKRLVAEKIKNRK